ncbi:hypothetical protein FBULB1_2898 [Fusarium bulbicola]|nr:hypothetical protein FBULB1_2898 [Fusarium bulbicola]
MASIGAEEGPNPHVTPHTCEHCQKIDLDGAEEEHMVSKAEVLEFEIWSSKHTDEGSAVSSDPRLDNYYVFSPAHKPRGLSDGGVEFHLATEKGKSTHDLQSHTLFTPDIEELAESERRVIYSKPMLADPLTQGTIASIKHWISKCEREQAEAHLICSVSEPHFLPSRLIRVRPQGSRCKLSLVSGKVLKGQGVRFAALSSCWGANMGVTLTTNNLESSMEEISWEMVPKTIQDAALTTERLGIDYLWVDSFCIIQDSPDDKTLEISQMTEVYTHATLTIMAKRANNAQEGFLHKRLLPSGTSSMMIRYRNVEKGTVTLSFESALSDEFGTRLDTRGWVLQEYSLSRRLLTIGNWATEWSCRQERYSPGNVDGWTRETKKETDPFKYNESGWREKTDTLPEVGHTLDAIAFFAAHPGRVLPRPGQWPANQTWNGLVESYTERYLSEPTDRIRAIAGLAKNLSVMYESQHGSKYAAGLWCQDLPGALLWRNSDRQKLPRPTKWQGPSWSWVSINSTAQCNFARRSPCKEVEDLNCELVSPEAPFGELKEGGAVLLIKGCAIELEWRYTRPKKPKEKFGTGLSDIRYLNSGHTYVNAKVKQFLDVQEPTTDWTRITLLLIDPGWHSNAEGIILKKVHCGKYSRLGYFELDYNGDTKGFNSPLPPPRSWEKQVFEIIS